MSTVLVIGASRGIGLEFVRQYTADGVRVIATARDAAGLTRLRDLGAIALRLDVADPASISGLAWQLDGEEIDAAVYVAGVVSRPGADTPPSQPEFDHLMHTNVLGAMQAIPQVAPLVEAAGQGRGGKFVFISSDMARIGEVASSYCWTYRVSKAALNMAVAAAPVGVEDSVSAMRRTIAGLSEADKGGFIQLDGRHFPSW